MIDFSKHSKGDIVRVACCDQCAKATSKPLIDVVLCEICGHQRPGSIRDCIIGDWLVLTPVRVSHN